MNTKKWPKGICEVTHEWREEIEKKRNFVIMLIIDRRSLQKKKRNNCSILFYDHSLCS